METKERFAKLCKERMVEELVSCFKERPNFIMTSYMGLTVSGLESLRRNLKKSSASYLVVKNSLLRAAFGKLKFKDESSSIDSGVGISFSGDDIIATCKALAAFAKDHEKFKIKGGVIDGANVTAEKIRSLAALPSKTVLLTQIVVGMKSPITGFVNILGGVLRKFVYVVDAIKTAKKALEPDAGAQEAKPQT